ncbi:hypothetical protein VFC49_06960 [Thermococcus sp. SY098]|uniref:hypothetical protein n=1 Tax=Thermococcus sp. SY098 TaxID=3111325 RepID=UPI002D78CFE7|nr:hypothetical protein [Thermococcus sp. SY098]WRS51825.1 hypothetical protein VFC49_06960 [Thermococcus sp. SY098]
MSETIVAKEAFNELATNINKEELLQNTTKKPTDKEKPKIPDAENKHTPTSIYAELMKEVLRELKYIASTSYQPDIVKSAERAARFLKVIIAENKDLFPGILKPKS